MIDLGIGNFLTLITEFIAIHDKPRLLRRPSLDRRLLIALVILYAALAGHRYWT